MAYGFVPEISCEPEPELEPEIVKSADRTIELLTQLIAQKQNLVNKLVEKGETASMSDSFDSLTQKAGDYIPKTYIFVDENGKEVAGVLVEEKTIFDATVNDVREGKVFAGDTGVKTGEKVIPSYHTEAGYTIIPNGSSFTIPFTDERYDYTKLQAIICPYNTSVADSVAADKITINDGVYAVNSAELIATITKDSENKTINLGITNNSGKDYLLRYFTYKEIY